MGWDGMGGVRVSQGWQGEEQERPGLVGTGSLSSLPKLLQWGEREGSDLALMQKEVVWWGRHTLPVGKVSMGWLLQGILRGCIPRGWWMHTGFLSPGASPRAGVQAAPPTP